MTVAAAENIDRTLVTVSVDTHLEPHLAAALDDLGRHLGELHFPTTEAGYAEFFRWTMKLGELEQVGI